MSSYNDLFHTFCDIRLVYVPTDMCSTDIRSSYNNLFHTFHGNM